MLAALLALTAAVSTVSAAQVIQRTWYASLGSGAAHGREVLTGYTDGTGRVSLNLVGMRADATYSPQVWSGTCSSPGNLIVRWSGLRTDGSGSATSVRTVVQVTMNKIWYYGRPGSIAIRFVSGTSVACANLGYYHATRIRIPSYSIDLPVVAGPSGYPYCNVAMYQKILWQPTERGVSFIFAHARTGMFLPLLNASKINNGAAMVGKLVYVYTSNSMLYTYRITQVRRHVTSVQSAVGITTEHLWLQTSEGPNFTYPKLIVIADRIASQPTSYAASHPTPHIVHCT
jgi:hypothetical protein